MMKQNVQEEFAARVRVNQQKLSSDLRTRFDYIVCGAGTSGCVVAARLAADLKTQVLLLEAGGADKTDLITNPNRWPMTLGSELVWGFVAEPNPQLNGRSLSFILCRGMGRRFYDCRPASGIPKHIPALTSRRHHEGMLFNYGGFIPHVLSC